MFFLVCIYSFVAYVSYLWVILITIPEELSFVKTVPVCVLAYLILLYWYKFFLVIQ